MKKINLLLLTFLFVSTFALQAQNVLMNEIFSRGSDPDLDWIEIYNPTADEVDLTGYKIYDSGGNAGTKPKMQFPDGTIVPALGYYVIVTDDTTEAGFGLSSNGEQVWLEDAAGTVIDDITFPAMPEVTTSYARMPDGSSNWVISAIITRGSSNQSPTSTDVRINEMYSRGITEDPDWVEVYNNSDTGIDISGYKIYDSGGNAGTKPKMEFPSGSYVPAYGFYAIVTDDTSEAGFGLSSGGEKVWLENAAGVVYDSVTFPAMEVGQSYGSLPDGGAMQLLGVLTKGSSNMNELDLSAKLNEIYSRGTSEDPDWIEIYNASAAPINLSGYKIYDSGGQSGSKPKKEFPAGTIITANGFYVIVVDDSDASGFGLSSGGETVWFENAQGVMLDSLIFPAMETTQSYSNIPDGSGTWMLSNTITKGASNGTTGLLEETGTVTSFGLSQNFPNPFNPSTVIRFAIPTSEFVNLSVYNMLGEKVASLVNKTVDAGSHEIKFDASELASGVYVYRIEAGSYVESNKMMLLK